MKLAHLLSVCAIAALPCVVLAQAPAPMAPAKSPCEKPDAFPGNLGSDSAKRNWQKSLDAYGVCIKKFSEEQRAIAEAAIKAGNDAVADYNAAVQTAKDEIAKSGN